MQSGLYAMSRSFRGKSTTSAKATSVGMFTLATNYTQAGAGVTATLSSAYTYGSAGAAVGFRFTAQKSGPLTHVYLFCRTVTGSPGAQTVELRSFNSGASSTPGSTLHASATASNNGAAKWVKFEFSSPYYVTKNTMYWIVLGDAAGSAGNNTAYMHLGVAVSDVNVHWTAYTSTNGFSTAGTAQSGFFACACVVKIGTEVFGSPYTTTGSYSSNTRKRGIRFDNFPGVANVLGLWHNGIVNSGVQVFLHPSGPQSPPYASESIAAGAASQLGVARFDPPAVVPANSTFRVVLTYSSSLTTPGYYSIEDYTSFVDVQKAAMMGGRAYDTIDNGSGGWTDDKSRYPRVNAMFAGFA